MYSSALRAFFFTCSCASHVPCVILPSLMCLVLYVLSCFTCLVPYVVLWLTCLAPYVLSCLTYVVPYVSLCLTYSVFCVLSWLTCLLFYVFLCLECSYVLRIPCASYLTCLIHFQRNNSPTNPDSECSRTYLAKFAAKRKKFIFHYITGN